MSDLSPEARQLLDATRGAGGPSAAQRLAMKKAVMSVAAPAAAVAGTSALVTKLGIAGLLVGIGAAAWVALAPASAPMEKPPELPEPSRGPASVVEAPEPEPMPAEVVAAPEPEKPRPPPPAPKPVAVAAVEPAPVPVAAPPPPPAPGPVVDEATLAREVEAIEVANETFRAGNFDDALAQLDGYSDEFPHGALQTEAAVVKVLVLCALKRVDEARALGETLPPANPAVRRLERSCIK